MWPQIDALAVVEHPRAWTYARHGQRLGGESPLEKEMVLTPSKQQLRHREVRWGGSWTAKLCTDEQKPRSRRTKVDELALDSEVRHRQEPCGVDVAGIERKSLFLFGEICIGVMIRRDKHQRKAVCTHAEVSSGHSTERDQHFLGKAQT